MKISVGLLAAAAVTALAGASLAADSDKFLVRGDAQKVLMEENELNVATAEAIGKDWVDEAAMMKAKTVLNTRQPSKASMNQVLQGRSSELRQYSFGNFANSGGLPILINGNQFIGAIGVGGSAPKLPAWSDEICACRALNKVICNQPPLLPDVQRTQ